MKEVNAMMDNFLQPGLLMIITGLLTLITGKEILRRVIFIAGPVITLCAVAISGADKLTTMFGIIFSPVSYTHLTLPTKA